jgi:uncharacterized membrane protein
MRNFILVLCVAIIASFGAPAVNAASGNFTVAAQEVKPENGLFKFPVSAFADGKARHYEFKTGPDQSVRFFVVKSVDGTIRAALDACDVCFRSKKGYVQNGNDMTCINCGLKFKTDKINEAKGGCNPHPLKRVIEGDKVVISQQDVIAGLKYFQ